jgi:hypothetical protein
LLNLSIKRLDLVKVDKIIEKKLIFIKTYKQLFLICKIKPL